jgi:microcystin-dependent protein
MKLKEGKMAILGAEMKTIRTLLWVGLAALSVTVLAARAAETPGVPMRGEIAVFAFNFCPVGWLPADGRELLIRDYVQLFHATGTKYGGDGKSTFAVPQLGCDRWDLTCCIATHRASELETGQFMGQIEMEGSSFCPAGWLPTDGRTLRIQDNQVLFSLLGTTYGGDGRTTFALPQLVCGAGGKCCIDANSGDRYPNRQ